MHHHDTPPGIELGGTELASIERELYVDASPEVVYQVISDPEHITQWWPDGASYEAVAGSDGSISFGDCSHGGARVNLSVVEAAPPTTFTFRWTHGSGEAAGPGNSLLVTFALEGAGTGTLVRFRETGFCEMGWEAAVLEATYREHVDGWDHFLPRLVRCASSVGTPA
jgi:uncharacterized protein YndB with AHSA1/START domain